MRPALLVIDMQEHFRGMAEGIVGRLNALIDTCHQLRVPVVFTRHGHLLDSQEARDSVLVQWWGQDGSIRYGSPAWQLLPELHVQPGRDTVLPWKDTYDAFQGTELEALLRGRGCDAVVAAGVMTNLCCETTARSAFTSNFRVLFLSDGTATATHAMHAATLLNMSYGFARVLTCAEAEQELRRSCQPEGGP